MNLDNGPFPNSPDLQRLREFLDRDPNVIFALIFGSHARGVQKPDSDLDVACYFDHPPEGLELLNFMSRLSNMVGK